MNYLVKINTFNFSLHHFWLLLPHMRGEKIKKINVTAKINWKISTKPKGIETSGASADNSAKLCTDRPATVEEVTNLVNTTSWRWDESYELLPVWCSHKIRGKTRIELLYLRMEKSKQRYQNKLHKSRASTTEGAKATRPALGPVTLSAAWCLHPFFIARQPREVTFDRYPSQDLVWHTKHLPQMPWKRALPFQIRLTESNNTATPLRWQSRGSRASDELATTLQERKGSSYGPKRIA